MSEKIRIKDEGLGMRRMVKRKQVIGKILAVAAVIFLRTSFVGFAAEKIAVTTTIMPLAFFVEEIGGEYVDVNVMIPSGGNPHAYEPTPGQMRALSKADLYVKAGSGVEFELMWMDKLIALNPRMKVCDVSKGIQLIPMEYDHDGHGDHDEYHGEHDPHVWLSLDNAVIIVENIRDALVDFSPDQKDVFLENAANLIVRLDELKRYASQTLGKMSNRAFLIFHPAWGYFARDFHLTQIAAEQAGKEPTLRQLNALIRQAQQLGVKVIFSSPQFSQKSAQVIAAEIKGRVILIDPLSKDYIENMRQVIEAFEMSM